MKRLVIAVALTCVLSGSVLAGDVPIVPGPTGSQLSQTTETSIGLTVLLALLNLSRF